MKSIGENIAALRKNSGMTQEALATAIGVSPQSVSKWENSTNLPDIALLPILADIFGVHIDQLFGRGVSEGCISEQVLEKGCDALLDVMGSSFYRTWGDADKESYAESMQEYKSYLKEHGDARTAVFMKHGLVHYREACGGLLLKRPAAGWASLFRNEEAFELLEKLCDKDFRTALAEVIKGGKTVFTLGTICRKCNIEDESALETKFRESRMFKISQLEVDDRMLDLYEFSLPEGKLAMLYAALAFAEECVHYTAHFYNNYGCCIEDLMG